jgi:hypothetical protein
MWNVQLPFRKKLSIWALMAMGLVCTACSAVRAKSLNAKAKDLACEYLSFWYIHTLINNLDEYSIVVIWAMAELCLGIIATNLGLSRSIYFYIFQRDSLSNGSKSNHPHMYGSRSRGGYSEQRDFVIPNFSQSSKSDRRPSVARSEDSEVPLKLIKKTTKIEMRVQ